MKTRLRLGDKTRPMCIEADGQRLLTVAAINLSPAQLKVLKDHLRLVAVAFTAIAQYEGKR